MLDPPMALNTKQEQTISSNYHLPGFIKSRLVRGVDDVDEHVGVFKVVPPVRPEPALPADVPNTQLEPRRVHAPHVEPLHL